MKPSPPRPHLLVEEAQRIAEAARRGAHRAEHASAVTEEEREARGLEDGQDAALIVVGAYCGLRMGEFLALRWRHVAWEAQRLHVQRSYTLGEESSPKGRKGRTVPLADQPAQALARLSQRSRFIKAGDLVFCSRVGGHVDGSALRRRYKAARDAVITEDPDVPVLRFHDLRHTFETLAASSFDLTNVHARPAAEDAARLTRIFAGGSAAALAPEGDEAPARRRSRRERHRGAAPRLRPTPLPPTGSDHRPRGLADRRVAAHPASRQVPVGALRLRC